MDRRGRRSLQGEIKFPYEKEPIWLHFFVLKYEFHKIMLVAMYLPVEQYLLGRGDRKAVFLVEMRRVQIASRGVEPYGATPFFFGEKLGKVNYRRADATSRTPRIYAERMYH